MDHHIGDRRTWGKGDDNGGGPDSVTSIGNSGSTGDINDGSGIGTGDNGDCSATSADTGSGTISTSISSADDTEWGYG